MRSRWQRCAARLAGLGRWPLSQVEAGTALGALRTLEGASWRPALYSPLLYDAQLLLFALTRATDATARLLPAIVGALMTVLPYFGRRALGRAGALSAALLLAFSPTWLHLSRTADGTILSAAALALVLLALWRKDAGADGRALWVAPVALALGMASGPGVYTVLFSGLVVAALAYKAKRWTPEVGTAMVALRSVASRRNALILLGVFLAVSSACWANPGGIGASVEIAGRWLLDLVPQGASPPWFHTLEVLATYESLLVVLALAGAVSVVRRRDLAGVFFLCWVAIALILGTLLGHRGSAWLPDVLLPLTLLAARGFQTLWRRLSSGWQALDGAAVAGGILLMAFGFLRLAGFTHTGQNTFLTQALVAVGMLIASWAAYWLWTDRTGALRVGVALILLPLAMYTVRISTALVYQTGADPREPLIRQPASPQLRDMGALLTDTSMRDSGDQHLLDIEYERSLDPWASWYTSRFPNARAVIAVGPRPSATVLITAARERADWPKGYAAQRFPLVTEFPEQPLSVRERLRWLIYRDPVGTEQPRELQVWVKLADAIVQAGGNDEAKE